jgi:nicotinate-nucleotide pyrophosphorylase (carboxylating)
MIQRDFHNPSAVAAFVTNALQEDIGDGDITSLSVLNTNATGVANCMVKEPCIIAGVSLAYEICKIVDPTLVVSFSCADGEAIKQVPVCIGTITGNLSSILKAERLLLNCMQRMSGIATKTKQFVQILAPKGIAVYDTRKTTPNFRLPEKWAVHIGGGTNHRFGLDDQILIKDNHIKAAGGVTNALHNCTAYCQQFNLNCVVVVEVQSIQDFKEAMLFPIVHRILIDNQPPEMIEQYVALRDLHAPNKKIEISGGVNLENIKNYAIDGIHCVSVGDLTHHIHAVDISLKVQ